MSSENAVLLTQRERPGNEAAIVFIHGFGGNPAKTWGNFPTLLGGVGALDQWNIHSLGYSTTALAPDIRGIWSADPSIPILAKYLGTRAAIEPLLRYKSLALIAHSMGGLVVQRALVDERPLASRISHLFLFGTPSGGLGKAGLFSFFKSQVSDMGADSEFIKDLRSRWNQTFSTHQPFKFWVVAGDQDAFVPPESSLVPFPEQNRYVVVGNHLQMVKPDNKNSMSVQVVTSFIVGKSAPSGPWNAARVAVETGQFQRAIDLLLPHAKELDADHVIQLALALDGTGRRADAIQVLQQSIVGKSNTDVRGVLAGRLKRRWLAEGRQQDAQSALQEYSEAYRDAVAAGNHDQAHYQGVNVAFMQLAFANDAQAACTSATEVLAHCRNARRDYWCAASEAEALLHLGRMPEAMAAYAKAVAFRPVPTPRQLESTYTQASWVISRLGDDANQAELDKVFGQVAA